MSINKNRIVIIGATACIAEHCARLWVAEQPADLILVGRDKEKTERIASELRTRSPNSSVSIREADFIDSMKIKTLIDDIAREFPIHIALIAHGSLPDQEECQTDLVRASKEMFINSISPTLFAEAIIHHMQQQNFGSLGIIGSAAGDRGRKSNYVYGAAKGLITRYTQGLQHRLAATNVTVSLIKPGRTETPMMQTMKKKGKRKKLAKPEDVARAIVSGMKKGKSTIYTPIKWAFIMLIVRHIPRFIFNKIDV